MNERAKNNLMKKYKDTEREIKVGDGWEKNKFQLVMNSDVTHINGSDYTNYEGKSNVKLIDNFPAFLWSAVTVKKGNNLVCRIGHPGIVTSVLHRLTSSLNEEVRLESNFVNNGKLQSKSNEMLYN